MMNGQSTRAAFIFVHLNVLIAMLASAKPHGGLETIGRDDGQRKYNGADFRVPKPSLNLGRPSWFSRKNSGIHRSVQQYVRNKSVWDRTEITDRNFTSHFIPDSAVSTFIDLSRDSKTYSSKVPENAIPTSTSLSNDSKTNRSKIPENTTFIDLSRDSKTNPGQILENATFMDLSRDSKTNPGQIPENATFMDLSRDSKTNPSPIPENTTFMDLSGDSKTNPGQIPENTTFRDLSRDSKTNPSPIPENATFMDLSRDSKTNPGQIPENATFMDLSRDSKTNPSPIPENATFMDLSRDSKTNPRPIPENATFMDLSRDSKTNLSQIPENTTFMDLTRDFKTNPRPIPENATFMDLSRDSKTNPSPIPENATFMDLSRDSKTNHSQIPENTTFMDLSRDSKTNPSPIPENATCIDLSRDSKTNPGQIPENATFMDLSRDSKTNPSPIPENATFMDLSRDSKTNLSQIPENATFMDLSRDSKTNPGQIPENATFMDLSRDSKTNPSPFPDNTTFMDLSRDSKTNPGQIPENTTFMDLSRDSKTNPSPILENATFMDLSRDSKTNPSPIPENTTFIDLSRDSKTNPSPIPENTTFLDLSRDSKTNPSPIPENATFMDLSRDSKTNPSPIPENATFMDLSRDSKTNPSPIPENATFMDLSRDSKTNPSPIPENTTFMDLSKDSKTNPSPIPENTTFIDLSRDSKTNPSPIPENATFMDLSRDSKTNPSPIPENATFMDLSRDSKTNPSPIPENATFMDLSRDSKTNPSPIPENTTFMDLSRDSKTNPGQIPENTTFLDLSRDSKTNPSPIPENATFMDLSRDSKTNPSPIPENATFMDLSRDSKTNPSQIPENTTFIDLSRDSNTNPGQIPENATFIELSRDSKTNPSPIPENTTFIDLSRDSKTNPGQIPENATFMDLPRDSKTNPGQIPENATFIDLSRDYNTNPGQIPENATFMDLSRDSNTNPGTVPDLSDTNSNITRSSVKRYVSTKRSGETEVKTLDPVDPGASHISSTSQLLRSEANTFKQSQQNVNNFSKSSTTKETMLGTSPNRITRFIPNPEFRNDVAPTVDTTQYLKNNQQKSDNRIYNTFSATDQSPSLINRVDTAVTKTRPLIGQPFSSNGQSKSETDNSTPDNGLLYSTINKNFESPPEKNVTIKASQTNKTKELRPVQSLNLNSSSSQSLVDKTTPVSLDVNSCRNIRPLDLPKENSSETIIFPSETEPQKTPTMATQKERDLDRLHATFDRSVKMLISPQVTSDQPQSGTESQNTLIVANQKGTDLDEIFNQSRTISRPPQVSFDVPQKQTIQSHDTSNLVSLDVDISSTSLRPRDLSLSLQQNQTKGMFSQSETESQNTPTMSTQTRTDLDRSYVTYGRSVTNLIQRNVISDQPQKQTINTRDESIAVSLDMDISSTNTRPPDLGLSPKQDQAKNIYSRSEIESENTLIMSTQKGRDLDRVHVTFNRPVAISIPPQQKQTIQSHNTSNLVILDVNISSTDTSASDPPLLPKQKQSKTILLQSEAGTQKTPIMATRAVRDVYRLDRSVTILIPPTVTSDQPQKQTVKSPDEPTSVNLDVDISSTNSSPTDLFLSLKQSPVKNIYSRSEIESLKTPIIPNQEGTDLSRLPKIVNRSPTITNTPQVSFDPLEEQTTIQSNDTSNLVSVGVNISSTNIRPSDRPSIYPKQNKLETIPPQFETELQKTLIVPNKTGEDLGRLHMIFDRYVTTDQPPKQTIESHDELIPVSLDIDISSTNPRAPDLSSFHVILDRSMTTLISPQTRPSKPRKVARKSHNKSTPVSFDTNTSSTNPRPSGLPSTSKQNRLETSPSQSETDTRQTLRVPIQTGTYLGRLHVILNRSFTSVIPFQVSANQPRKTTINTHDILNQTRADVNKTAARLQQQKETKTDHPNCTEPITQSDSPTNKPVHRASKKSKSGRYNLLKIEVLGSAKRLGNKLIQIRILNNNKKRKKYGFKLIGLRKIARPSNIRNKHIKTNKNRIFSKSGFQKLQATMTENKIFAKQSVTIAGNDAITVSVYSATELSPSGLSQSNVQPTQPHNGITQTSIDKSNIFRSLNDRSSHANSFNKKSTESVLTEQHSPEAIHYSRTGQTLLEKKTDILTQGAVIDVQTLSSVSKDVFNQIPQQDQSSDQLNLSQFTSIDRYLVPDQTSRGQSLNEKTPLKISSERNQTPPLNKTQDSGRYDEFNTSMNKFYKDLCLSKYDFVFPLSYVPLVSSCDSYVRCKFHNRQCIEFKILKCPYGYFWDSYKVACKEADKVLCPANPCQKDGVSSYAEAGNCRAYWTCRLKKSFPKCCPDRMSFHPDSGCKNDTHCTDACPKIGHRPPNGKNQCRPEVNFNFNHGLRDISGNNPVFGSANVVLKNGCAIFTGQSKINLWNFKGAVIGQNFVILLRFKPDPMAHRLNINKEHLVSNCGWNVVPSIDVFISPRESLFYFTVQTTNSKLTLKGTYHANSWNEIELSYNGKQLSKTVNGVVSSHYLSGDVIPKPASMMIGFCRTANGFHGRMDYVKIYFCNAHVKLQHNHGKIHNRKNNA